MEIEKEGEGERGERAGMDVEGGERQRAGQQGARGGRDGARDRRSRLNRHTSIPSVSLPTHTHTHTHKLRAMQGKQNSCN